MGIARGLEKRVIRTNITYAKRTVRIFSVSPQVSLSVFSLAPDLFYDCSRVLEYAKIRTVLQSTDRLELVNVARNDYSSYLAYLNTFLSIACGHVEIGRYAQERLLIVLGTSQYFFMPSL